MATEFNNWGAIADNLPKVLSQVVRKTALDGKAQVQARIRGNGQIDTGFMFNSVYTVTSEGTDYQGGKNALPICASSVRETEAYFAVAAFYSMHQNYGTRYQPGRPFWEPSIEAIRPGFEAALSAIEGKLKGSIG